MRQPLVLVTALRSLGWRIHIRAGLSAVHSKRGCAAPDRAVQRPAGAQTAAIREAGPDAKPRDRAASRRQRPGSATSASRLWRKPTPGVPSPEPTDACGGGRCPRAPPLIGSGGADTSTTAALWSLPAEPHRHSPEPTRNICLLPEPKPVRSPDSRRHSPPRPLFSRMRSVSRRQTQRPPLRQLAPRRWAGSSLSHAPLHLDPRQNHPHAQTDVNSR